MQEKTSILIVDDNIALCKTMDLVLKRKGYAVTCAHDGPEAIIKVKERPFDIIFMDMKMPGMDGLEAYRRIRKVRTGVVLAVMTAYAAEARVREALQEGACGIMYKPLDLPEMIAFIERVGKPKQVASILPADDDVGA